MDGRKDSLTDTALDREIESLLAIDPSPEFVARIRARVESEPPPANGWMVWRLATSRVVLSIEAAAVVFMAVTLAWKAWQPIEHAASSRTAAVEEEARTTPPAASVPVVVTEPRRDPAPAVVHRTVRREPGDDVRAAALPEVLIPENEKRGFELFLEELRDEKSAAVMAEAASGRTTPGPPWLDIEPVIIEPLHDVGVHQGEGQ